MFHLTLTEDERDLLEATLEETVADLRVEIRDTDRHDYRERLKEREAMYKRLLTALHATHELMNA